MHRTQRGKHWGRLTAKFVMVLECLVYGFANSQTGLCFPSHQTIAERCGCSPATVNSALRALEDCGILSWYHRLARIRAHCPYGSGWRWRVIRTSNSYRFVDPASNNKFRSGTTNLHSKKEARQELLPLAAALAHLEQRINGRMPSEEAY
jgi:hypothetical protein